MTSSSIPLAHSRRSKRYDAKIILPDGWKYGTSLPLDNASGNQVTFKPISLDMLVDSPDHRRRVLSRHRHYAAGRADPS